MKFDKSKQVYQNYANVQCLNCHSQSKEHPFGDSMPINLTKIKKNCTTCHNQDQSPTWYNKNDKGLATSLNEKYFAKKIKEVRCPKSEDL